MVYTNKMTQQSAALEEEIRSVTEVVVKDTQEDSMEHKIKE
jgi:hypothetical protein